MRESGRKRKWEDEEEEKKRIEKKNGSEETGKRKDEKGEGFVREKVGEEGKQRKRVEE